MARAIQLLRSNKAHKLAVVLLLMGLVVVLTSCSGSVDAGGSTLTLTTGEQGAQTSTGVQLLALLTLLSLAPAALMLMTSFTRIIVVLSFVRSAIGVAQMPPNQILLGLALFLTVFVMAPTWQSINSDALQPYLSGQITQEVAIQRGEKPIREFMFKQAREKDISLFVSMAKIERPKAQEDVPTYVLIPAFVTSELRTAFEMGFLIFIPFLIIDMVVSSTLMAMGMMMLPPAMVSLPFKVLLFVLVDGWHLVLKSLVVSFG